MPTLNATITGTTATSVVLTALVDGSTNMTPAGVSLPANLTYANGVWSFPFTGSSPLYAYTYVVTLASGATQSVSDTIVGNFSTPAPGSAPGDLITLARANQNATLASLPSDYLASLISASSDAIQRACMRKFGPGAYTEYHDGLGYPNQYLQLDQCPVTAITRLATRPVPALHVTFTGTAPRATVSTTATGLMLNPGGTVLYSAATTLAAIATAVTAITGWTATVDPQFTTYPSADLRPLQGAITALNRPAALEIYSEVDNGPGYNDSYANLPWSGWRLDADSGQLWGHFPEGRSNIRVDYTAGDDTVPADIQQACVRLASLMAEDERRDSRIDREQMGPYQVYFTARASSLIRDPGVWDLISPHRDLSQLI